MAASRPLPVKLYNTLTRDLETFTPRIQGKAGIYCCGPTVYNYQHIGNLKTYIFEDVLARALRFAGYDVNHVMNITDVGHLVSDADEGEDKMMVAMKREKKKSHEIADFYTEVFFDDCKALNIRRPDVVCKATDHITEMIELIKRIETNGFTYFNGGNLYFDVSKCSDYGKLAKLDLEKLKAGARIEVDPNKKTPFDFVLWFTKSKFENQELQWDSPWGRGYPGWHIECSAMSIKYLGEHFDIHCGGIDHIPVHHTNEIAQSEAAVSKPWVNVWMHSEFMVLNKEKMSKSKGGFITLKNLTEGGYTALAFRYFCLSAHYRAQLNFSYEALEGAKSSVEKLKGSVLRLKEASDPAKADRSGPVFAAYIKKFEDSVLNDLNTAQVLAAIWSILSDSNLSPHDQLALVYEFDEVLGLGAKDWQSESIDVPPEVVALAAKREELRKSKNWAEADAIRNEITKLGYSVEDSQGTAKFKKL